MSALSEERIQEIRVWFEERGYELFWHEHAGAWRAPYIPQGHRIGSADYGSGTTALEAVEDAKRRFEAGQPKTHVVEMTGTVGAKATLSGSAVIKTDSDSAEVVDSAQVNLPSIDEKIATEQLGFGWRIWFEPEPDGTFTAVAGDYDTGEVMRMSKGDSYEDALLELGADLRPPSDEVRREQQAQRDADK